MSRAYLLNCWELGLHSAYDNIACVAIVGRVKCQRQLVVLCEFLLHLSRSKRIRDTFSLRVVT